MKQTSNATSLRADPWYVRVPLIILAVALVGWLVVLPVVYVFASAFEKGWEVYWRTVSREEARHALRLTLCVAASAVAMNTVFGLAAAWWLTRRCRRGRNFWVACLDLPLTLSPVVAGLCLVLFFGARSPVGSFLERAGVPIIYNVGALVLATALVTMPFVARELMPTLEAIGTEQEQAARTLGARPWQVLLYVTLPQIKWGLLYGILLCSARAIGEFGAVSVVSGRKAGRTDTLTIHIEKLYQSLAPDALPAAFAVASLLTVLGLISLAAQWYMHKGAWIWDQREWAKQ
ncbi:MAG: sulfate/thiosulfate transporter permease subunit [Gemmataceae bacterium]